MIIENHTQLKVQKDNKDIVLDVPPDMPLGLLFDALMELKGYVVDRMVKSHQEEEKQAEEQMKQECDNGCDS